MDSLIQAVKKEEDKHREHDKRIDNLLGMLFNNKKCDVLGHEYEVNENNEIIRNEIKHI